MKRIMVVMLPVIVLLVLTGFYFALERRAGRSGASPAQPQRPAKVVVAVAEKADIADSLELTGSVEPWRIARLASPAEGPVVDLAVREGDRTQSGEKLLVIGRGKSARSLIVSLREELRKESENLRRVSRLVADALLPAEQLNQARAAYENVHARLIKAEEAVEDHTIRAPWSGVVSAVHVREGAFVAPRALLLEMYDPFSLVIRAAVPERNALDMNEGAPVEVRLDAYPDKRFQGRIERVYPDLDPRHRTRTIEIVPEASPELLPGMFARLKLSLEVVPGAVVVPVEAIVTAAEGMVVFVVKEGRAVARPVETGIEDGSRVQIVHGVDPGEAVVVAGNESLKDGMAVSVPPAGGSGKPAEKENRTEGGR